MTTIDTGGLRLTLDVGVQIEIIGDDWPGRFPWLGEPREEIAIASLGGERAYGALSWYGFPSFDALIELEVTASGNKTPRFRYSSNGGTEWAAGGIEVPMGASVALGTTGLIANFAASPLPETGTTYEFSGPGAATKTGAGPEVTITGSGSIDGLIEIQTAIGQLRHRLNNGAWSAPFSMGALPVALPNQVLIDFPDGAEHGLEIEVSTLFQFTARGRFALRASGGGIVETYERLRVGDPLYFASPRVPSARRSKLIQSAAWVGTVRPSEGTFSS